MESLTKEPSTKTRDLNMSSITSLRSQLAQWTRIVEDKNDELEIRQAQVEALEQMCRGLMHLTLNTLDVAKSCEGLFKDKSSEFPNIPRKGLIEEEVSDLMPQMISVFSTISAALNSLNTDAVNNEESLKEFSALLDKSAKLSKKENRSNNLTPVLPTDFLLEASNRSDAIRLRTARRISASSNATGETNYTVPPNQTRPKGKGKRVENEAPPSAASVRSVQSVQALLAARESNE